MWVDCDGVCVLDTSIALRSIHLNKKIRARFHDANMIDLSIDLIVRLPVSCCALVDDGMGAAQMSS